MYTEKDVEQLKNKLETAKKLKSSLDKVSNGYNKGACLSFNYAQTLTYTNGTTETRKDETRMFMPEAVMPVILSALSDYFTRALKKLESEIESTNIYNFSNL